jgi:hypothetical protein
LETPYNYAAMRSLKPTMKLAMLCLLAAVLAGCGGLSSGLTTSGSLFPAYGSDIAPADPVTVVFHRPLDSETLAGNVFVAADGISQQFTIAWQDNGYKLIILPDGEWPAGAMLAISLTGGPDGIRYIDGRTFDTIELVYYVGQP